ncbi:MAG: hypothetical protein BYD32DRAFT_172562 [Podila humilis]|nr:MAG: hypothetical protein BYD32DRAFT_172562 [Podila humilis]
MYVLILPQSRATYKKKEQNIQSSIMRFTLLASTLGLFILVISTQTVQAAPLPDPTKIENSLPKGSLMPCPKSWNPRAGHGPACQRAA